MDIRSLGFSRCCQAIIFLIASFPAFSAYTPPATPDVPLYFEFVGLNAEAEANEFRTSQCDSDNFSWYSTGQICAVGDPTNPTCSVWMAYHATDVNQCQGYELPEQPTPFLDPDVFTEEGGSNQNLISKLELMRIQDFNKNFSDGQYQNKDISLTRQTNSLLSTLSRTLQYSNDNRSVVDAINTWGSSHMIETQKQYLENTLYRKKHDDETKATFVQEIGNLGSKLNYMHDTLIGIENKTGSGGGKDYSGTLSDMSNKLSFIKNSASYIEGLSNSIDYAALDIVAGNHSDSDKEQSLLSDINESIKSLGGTPSDNSDVVEQLIESNNSLSDITIRMRDIENAIGKSEKSIVDAIGKGVGSDPDAISETGCAAFSCSSNSPECYIARKAWERSCAATKNETDGQGLIDSLTSSLKEYNDSQDSDIQNIDAGKVDTSSLMSHYGEGNGFSSGGSSECPAPYVVDVVISTITIDLSPFCQLAAVIKWFVIAFATVGAGLMIAKYT